MYSRSGSSGPRRQTGASERSSLIRCKARGMALVPYKVFILCCLELWGEWIFPAKLEMNRQSN